MDNNENGERKHRIGKEDEIVVYKMIEAQLRNDAGDSKEKLAEKNRRRAALEEFLLGITPIVRGKPRSIGPRRLCFEDITTLLGVTGITYRALLTQLARDPDGNPVELSWASKMEEKMCAYCDLVTPEQREMIYALVRGMLAPTFVTAEMEQLPPIARLARANALRAHSIGAQRSQMRELGTENIYIRRCMPYNFTAIQLHLVPYMAQHCYVSPHWLLGLGETATVLADTTETERIMDLYCLLPVDRKIMVLNAVETALTVGGV